ncbi:lectin-receptor kinase [Euphorbia peplus]|nr:lectin-receptor kinase [Euphorbia peplus]
MDIQEFEAAQSALVKSQNYEFNRVTGAKDIPYDVLAQATDEFNEKKKLGLGGFGALFKGYCAELNKDIAVKRISKSSTQGITG